MRANSVASRLKVPLAPVPIPTVNPAVPGKRVRIPVPVKFPARTGLEFVSIVRLLEPNVWFPLMDNIPVPVFRLK